MTLRNFPLLVPLIVVTAAHLALPQANPVEPGKPANASSNSAATQPKSEKPTPVASDAIPSDVVKLVNTASENFDQNYHAAKNYTFQRSTDQTFYDKHGKVEDHHTAKYDVVGLDEGEYDQLIEWNEKPLSPEEKAKRNAEEARDNATAHKSKHPKICQRKGWFGLFGRQVTFPLVPFGDFPGFFKMRISGVESVRGRPAYVVEALPRSDTKPADDWEKGALSFQAKLWIDVKDTIPVQVQYDEIADCQCMLKGSFFEAEWHKIDDAAWLPSRLSFTARVKLLGETVIHVEFISSNFRKFRVDTHIAEASVRPVQEAPAVPQASAVQATDEPAIRSLVEKIIAAYQQRDSQTLFSFFTGNSPNLLVLKLEIESGWAQQQALERKNFTIRDIDIKGDEASAHVGYEWSSTDQAPNDQAGNGVNFFILELTREQGTWRLWNFTSGAAGLAEEFLTAESDEERNRLLTEEKHQLTLELVELLVGQGHEALAMGQYDTARTAFTVARKVADQLHDHKALAWALYGLGHGSLAQGDEAAGADYFQQAVAICETTGDQSLLAAAFSFIGQHYAELGNYRKAMEYYRKSIAASKPAAGNELLALTLASVGDTLAEQGNDDQALEYYEGSLKLFVFGKTLSSIGDVMTRRGSYAQALEHYQKSAQLFQDSAYFSLAAGALRSIGDNYFVQERLDEALGFYQNALKQYEEDDHKIGIATSLGRIANVYYKKREYDRAVEFGARARAIATQLESPSDLSSILTTLGKAYLATGNYVEAKQALTEAVSAVEKLRTHIVGTESDQGLFFERKIDPYHAMVELLVKQQSFSEALEYAEREKGRVLLDVLRNGRENIAKAMTREEQAQERALNQVLVTLNSQLQRENLQPRPNQPVVQALNNELKKTRLQYEAFETGLYAAHPSLRGQRGESFPLSEEELNRLVPNSGVAFLEYVVQPERTYLFVLTREHDGSPSTPHKLRLNAHVLEIPADQLTRLIAGFRAKLAANALDFREPAQRLYQLLLSPAEKDLTGDTTLCLVPAGPLWELPFQALLTRQGRYLLEERAIFYVPSLSVLSEMRNRVPEPNFVDEDSDDLPVASTISASSLPAISSHTLFAVGNPSLSPSYSQKGAADSGVSPYVTLPEQEKLVRLLGQMYGSQHSRILTGQAATEETVKAEAGKYQILHFSTHGTLDNDNPLYSHLLMNAASPEEDGLLEAREIMQLNLRADLAVLSACETARGRVRAGEGLIGMSWALFVAGTPTTVASQWQVDSASTARLMSSFHRKLKAQLLPADFQPTKAQALRHPLLMHRLLKAQSPDVGWGIRKAELLRQASLSLMSDPKYRHPFYWAGFVLMGDGL